VNDISVSLEHVDLLNSLDGLDIELLKRRLQLLVIHPRALVDLFDLSSRCALSTVAGLSAFLDFAHFLPNLSACRNCDRIRRARRRKT
jgi:hypothetical protein